MAGQRKLGPSLIDNTGHTEWPDGRVHHSGMTTVFAPNTKVAYNFGGKLYDIDYNSTQEGRSATQPTYAAITARSHHPGNLVCASFLDGATKPIRGEIDLNVWRAMGRSVAASRQSGFILIRSRSVRRRLTMGCK
jgi:hypothetical protein